MWNTPWFCNEKWTLCTVLRWVVHVNSCLSNASIHRTSKVWSSQTDFIGPHTLLWCGKNIQNITNGCLHGYFTCDGGVYCQGRILSWAGGPHGPLLVYTLMRPRNGVRNSKKWTWSSPHRTKKVNTAVVAQAWHAAQTCSELPVRVDFVIDSS